MNEINVLVVGDVCANIGVLAVQNLLPQVIEQYNIYFTVLNAENALNGEGLDEPLAKVFFDAGVDIITGGNHSLQNFALRKNFLQVENVLRPANIPYVGGVGFLNVQKGDYNFCVLNLLGRENMRFVDSPFSYADNFIPDALTPQDPFKIIDFHAESTEEKEAFGLYVDGRVSLVFGTHTHVQTSDEKILPLGTGYITDVGFVGAEYSILGSNPKFAVEKQKYLYSKEPRWDLHGNAIFSAIVATLDCTTKKAKSIKRIIKNCLV